MNHETKKRPTGSYSLIFRAFVFLVLLAGCHGASGPDVLIEHNNQNLRGALQGCTADDCTLDQKPVPRSAIDWIGFRNQPPPPQAESAVADEVHLTDASVHPGRLVSVDAAKVATESGDYPRDRVAWIHLATSATGEAPVKNTEGSGEESAQFCPVDRPLGGRVQVDYVQRFDPSFYVGPAESQNRIKLRFRLVNAYKPYEVQGRMVYTSSSAPYEFAASTLDYEVSTSGYTSNAHGQDCKVPAQSRHGSIRFGDYGPDHNHPGLKFVWFRSLHPNLEVQEPDEVDAPWPDQGTCRDQAHPDNTSLAAAPGIMSNFEVRPESCGTLPYNFCADAGYCSLGHTIADPSAMKECLAHPGKHVILPFEGTGTHSGKFDFYPSVQAKWEICCGCGENPDSGPSPPDAGKNRQ